MDTPTTSSIARPCARLAIAAATLVACANAHRPAPSALPAASSRAPTPASPPAGCVDPRADAWTRLGCENGEPCGSLRAGDVGDLDGDGVDDPAWAAESLCGATGNCSYATYLTNRGCPRYVGVVAG